MSAIDRAIIALRGESTDENRAELFAAMGAHNDARLQRDSQACVEKNMAVTR